jgi:hypothetical protein
MDGAPEMACDAMDWTLRGMHARRLPLYADRCVPA